MRVRCGLFSKIRTWIVIIVLLQTSIIWMYLQVSGLEPRKTRTTPILPFPAWLPRTTARARISKRKPMADGYGTDPVPVATLRKRYTVVGKIQVNKIPDSWVQKTRDRAGENLGKINVIRHGYAMKTKRLPLRMKQKVVSKSYPVKRKPRWTTAPHTSQVIHRKTFLHPHVHDSKSTLPAARKKNSPLFSGTSILKNKLGKYSQSKNPVPKMGKSYRNQPNDFLIVKMKAGPNPVNNLPLHVNNAILSNGANMQVQSKKRQRLRQKGTKSKTEKLNPTSETNEKELINFWKSGGSHLNLFRFYHPPRRRNFYMLESLDTYATHFEPRGCYIEGLEQNTRVPILDRCFCRRGYHGEMCNIPDVVYFTSASKFISSMVPRKRPRRIINALAFNMEYALLEARINELQDVVDVFIILESNYTNFGEPKPLHLLERLRMGYLLEFHSKISYLMMDHFPPGGRDNGWVVDQYQRTFIGREGMKQLRNVRDDDLFIYTDADEIPSRESLLFLRWHDGYPEPFGFTLRWSVYGFFWRQSSPTKIFAGCSIRMFRDIFKFDAFDLRDGNYQKKAAQEIRSYTLNGGLLYEWYLGDTISHAGWHCSWCLPVEGIRNKLTSAINADFPRWGDFPEKLNLIYLRNLVKSGVWFDDQTRVGSLRDASNDFFFAPDYMLQHYQSFKFLLNVTEVDSLPFSS